MARFGMRLLACLVLMAAGCAREATTATSSASVPQAASVPAVAPDAASGPAVGATTDPESGAATIAPALHAPAAGSMVPAEAGQAPALACASDADCAVKDVGSCCGYRPACVNAQTETFPDAVKARCAAEGRVGTCGFAAVDGCQCREGRCAALTKAAGPAGPEPLQ